MISIGDDMATFTKLKRERGEAYLIRYVHPSTKKFVRKVVWCTKIEAEMIVKKIEADIALGKFLIEADDAIQYTLSQLVLQFRKYSISNKSLKTVDMFLTIVYMLQLIYRKDFSLQACNHEDNFWPVARNLCLFFSYTS